jgi:hypothetical protein
MRYGSNINLEKINLSPSIIEEEKDRNNHGEK